MKKGFLFLLVVSIVSCSYEQENEFDVVCHQFDKLESKLSSENLSNEQRYIFINRLVDESLTRESDANQGFDAVLYAVPSERYDIYRSVVQEITNKEWTCESMKKLFATIGE